MQYLGSVGIFGGSVTFASLFTLACDADSHIPKLVGYASALFLGAVLACVPIFVALHTEQAVAKDEESRNEGLERLVRDPPLTFVRFQVGADGVAIHSKGAI